MSHTPETKEETVQRLFYNADGSHKTVKEINDADPLIKPIGAAIITTLVDFTGLPIELVMGSTEIMTTSVQSAAMAADYIRQNQFDYL